MTSVIINEKEVIESEIKPSKKFKLPSFKKLGMAAIMLVASVQFINMVVTKDEFDFKYEPIAAIPEIPDQDFKVNNLTFPEEKVEPIAQLSFDSNKGSLILESLPQKVENKAINKVTKIREKFSEKPLNSKNINKL